MLQMDNAVCVSMICMSAQWELPSVCVPSVFSTY